MDLVLLFVQVLLLLLVVLHKPDLPRNFIYTSRSVWYLRATSLTLWEYLGAVIAGSQSRRFVKLIRGRAADVACGAFFPRIVGA
ncbi:MAG: hypothetical protein ACT4TC_14130 [Myxococcaceae bacterium]